MIRLQDIHVTFAPDTVMEKKGLRGLDLSINEGEFVTVIGSNGAGKSTLLNSIAGEVLPTSGSIYIDDDNMTKLSGYARAHFVARVFQDPLAGSCGDLTIAENLALAQRRGKSRRLSWALSRSLKQELKEVLKRLKLGLEDRRIHPCLFCLAGKDKRLVY